ncbi:MAG: CHAD domain-containing protein [Micromonosporaceae bacterium]
MLEEERKYDVGPRFALPDLRAAAPKLGRIVELPAAVLRSTFYDTADLRLSRTGACLRRRRGENGLPWAVELPYGDQRHRREVTSKGLTSRGLSSRIPDDLVRLVLSHTRGAPLSAVATLQTSRQSWQICDADGTVLVEILDDTVTVLDGRRTVSTLREWRTRPRSAGQQVMADVELLLTAAGATPTSTLTIVRALGPLASEPPDLPPPGELSSDPSAADVLIAELRRQLRRLLSYDPVARIDPADLDGVDKLLDACRQLQVDLRAFAPLFEAPAAAALSAAADPMIDALSRFTAALRAVTTPQLLRDRLAKANSSVPASIELIDHEVIARLDGALAEAGQQAVQNLATLLGGAAHTALLNQLITAARAPRLRRLALEPALEILPALAATFWERLAHAVEKLELDSPAGDWQVTRTAASRLQRLTRLATPAAGERARRMAEALAPVISALDAEHEARRASTAWYATTEARPADRMLAVAAGRLIEREQTTVHAARQSFQTTWQEQNWDTATEWLV